MECLEDKIGDRSDVFYVLNLKSEKRIEKLQLCASKNFYFLSLRVRWEKIRSWIRSNGRKTFSLRVRVGIFTKFHKFLFFISDKSFFVK